MRGGGKRSASGLTAGLLSLLIGGCAADAPPSEVADAQPVAILTTPPQWSAGVNEHELTMGESLAFDFGRPVLVGFHMESVEYTLELTNVKSGRTVRMAPCPTGADCHIYTVSPASRWWLEKRVK